MNDYTSAQIMAMQRDAIRRVNEMQRIARERVFGTQQPPASSAEPETSRGRSSEPRRVREEVSSSPSKTPEQERPEPHRVPSSSETGPRTHSLPVELPRRNSSPPSLPGLNLPVPNALGGILDRIGLDNDQLILGGLILVLINEGADNLLILALAYILL